VQQQVNELCDLDIVDRDLCFLLCPCDNQIPLAGFIRMNVASARRLPRFGTSNNKR
jgi:hypothetical protein